MDKVMQANDVVMTSDSPAAAIPAANVADVAVEYRSFASSSPLAVREPRPPRGDFHPAQLHELNRAFLYLLRTESLTAPAHSDVACLAPAAMPHLLRLSSEAMQRAAHCPFALFDLNALAGTEKHSISTACHVGESAMSRVARLQFANAALFYAWHELRVAPARARLRFGLNVDIAATLLAAAPAEIAAWASVAAVTPRCAHHAQFWLTLLQRAESSDAVGLQSVFWLGRQLVSGEMHRF